MLEITNFNFSSSDNKILMEYDHDRKAGFIKVNEKYIICIKTDETTFKGIGLSSRNDGDAYDETIGKALAYYRAKQN